METPDEVDASSRPLAGHKFCCTSIPTEIMEILSQKIKAMGGEFYRDLTQEIKFLIVGERHTPKYNYSIRYRYDMNFLRPSFIYEFHNRWLQGESVDLFRDLETYGKLRVFEGLVIVFGRIAADRTSVENLVKLVEANGGIVKRRITNETTELISDDRSGNSERTKFAAQQKIPIVHPDWILQSVERDATLSEEYYDILAVPEDQIGVKACKCWKQLRRWREQKAEKMAEVNRGTGVNGIGNTTDRIGDSRKRRADFVQSGELPGQLPVERLKKVRERTKTSEAWSSIMKSVAKNGPKVGKSGKSGKFNENNPWSEAVSPLDGDRTALTEEKAENSVSVTLEKSAEPQSEPPGTENGIFAEHRFAFFGFSDKQLATLRAVVASHGGSIAESHNCTHFVLNSSLSLDSVPNNDTNPIPKNAETVTEWYIERSLHLKRPALDKWGRFVTTRLVPGLHKVKIGISGFFGIELLHLERLLGSVLVSAAYRPVFTRDCDLLIAASRNAKKVHYAVAWAIPVVSIDWIWELLRTESIPAVRDARWSIYVPKGITRVPLPARESSVGPEASEVSEEVGKIAESESGVIGNHKRLNRGTFRPSNSIPGLNPALEVE